MLNFTDKKNMQCTQKNTSFMTCVWGKISKVEADEKTNLALQE